MSKMSPRDQPSFNLSQIDLKKLQVSKEHSENMQQLMDLYMLNHQLESKPESNINIIDRSYISQRDNKGSKISKTNKNSARSTKQKHNPNPQPQPVWQQPNFNPLVPISFPLSLSKQDLFFNLADHIQVPSKRGFCCNTDTIAQ